MDNLLIDGVAKDLVIPTDYSKKITVDGITKSLTVYKIRLDCLFFNDQNDRIATWISKYKFDNQQNNIKTEDRNEYNKIIENFIIQSNPSSIEQTKNNISMFDQKEPGVVLNDGRIIDGNRRFTCLRMLSKDNDRFKYFEAVIIDKEIDLNKKEIKILELSIQQGEDKKVQYDPIDRLVGIYNDIIDTKLLTVTEYAKSVNETENSIKQKIEQAELMIEFLDFINAPKQFYIARDFEIENPLNELQKLLKKCNNDEQRNNMKNAVFCNLLMKPNSDMGQFIRNIKSITDSKFIDSFLDEQMEIANEVLENIPNGDDISAKYINEKVRNQTQITNKLNHSMEKHKLMANKIKVKNQPLQELEKAIVTIDNIDTAIITKLEKHDQLIIKNNIDKARILLDRIEEKLEVIYEYKN